MEREWKGKETGKERRGEGKGKGPALPPRLGGARPQKMPPPPPPPARNEHNATAAAHRPLRSAPLPPGLRLPGPAPVLLPERSGLARTPPPPAPAPISPPTRGAAALTGRAVPRCVSAAALGGGGPGGHPRAAAVRRAAPCSAPRRCQRAGAPRGAGREGRKVGGMTERRRKCTRARRPARDRGDTWRRGALRAAGGGAAPGVTGTARGATGTGHRRPRPARRVPPRAGARRRRRW